VYLEEKKPFFIIIIIIPFCLRLSPKSKGENQKVVIDGHSVGVVCLNVWERRRRRRRIKTGLFSPLSLPK
jgi:hypothetical protein